MRARRLVALISTAALVVALLPGVALGAHPDRTRGGGPEPTPVAPSVNTVYIVQMAERPVVAYTGDIAGYQATRPARGQKIDPAGADVVHYASLLNERHARALATVGGRKLYDYVYTFNGFAATMTPAQAAKLATQAGIAAVTPEETFTVDTSSTPSFLGLAAPARTSSSAWSTRASGRRAPASPTGRRRP